MSNEDVLGDLAGLVALLGFAGGSFVVEELVLPFGDELVGAREHGEEDARRLPHPPPHALEEGRAHLLHHQPRRLLQLHPLFSPLLLPPAGEGDLVVEQGVGDPLGLGVLPAVHEARLLRRPRVMRGMEGGQMGRWSREGTWCMVRW